jgi:hypothetical protein
MDGVRIRAAFDERFEKQSKLLWDEAGRAYRSGKTFTLER